MHHLAWEEGQGPACNEEHRKTMWVAQREASEASPRTQDEITPHGGREAPSILPPTRLTAHICSGNIAILRRLSFFTRRSSLHLLRIALNSLKQPRPLDSFLALMPRHLTNQITIALSELIADSLLSFIGLGQKEVEGSMLRSKIGERMGSAISAVSGIRMLCNKESLRQELRQGKTPPCVARLHSQQWRRTG